MYVPQRWSKECKKCVSEIFCSQTEPLFTACSKRLNVATSISWFAVYPIHLTYTIGFRIEIPLTSVTSLDQNGNWGLKLALCSHHNSLRNQKIFGPHSGWGCYLERWSESAVGFWIYFSWQGQVGKSTNFAENFLRGVIWCACHNLTSFSNFTWHQKFCLSIFKVVETINNSCFQASVQNCVGNEEKGAHSRILQKRQHCWRTKPFRWVAKTLPLCCRRRCSGN